MKPHVSRSAGETVELGLRYGATLRPGDVVALVGELGSGKTVFVSGVCRALGIRAPVSSPSFTLINEYRGSDRSVAHIDLYRITRREELADLGLQEYFCSPWVCLVEWAERAEGFLPASCRRVFFQHGASPDERIVTLAVESMP
jgi:tRNA threonylcarbamoyladenosine biosynthesis protein TsaE